MTIRMPEKQLREEIRKTYLELMIEQEAEQEMTQDSADRMHKIAFVLASDLVSNINRKSMENQVDTSKLLDAVINQAKLRLKK